MAIEVSLKEIWDFSLDSFRVKLITDKDHPLGINPRIIFSVGEGTIREFNTTLDEIELAVKTAKAIQAENASL